MFPPKYLYTVTEAGAALGFSASTIYKLIHKGLLRAFRLGNKAIRIPYCELERFCMNFGRIGTPIQPSKPDVNYL